MTAGKKTVVFFFLPQDYKCLKTHRMHLNMVPSCVIEPIFQQEISEFILLFNLFSVFGT